MSGGNEVSETERLLEIIRGMSGYDFRSYARASVERRIVQFMAGSGCGSISELILKIQENPEFLSRLIRCFSIPVTEMFRDPFVFRTIRDNVIPWLRTWPHIKIWCAGCATGEEVYSLAVVLKEEGLYDKSMIYATDFIDAVLEFARQGIYKIEKIQEATRNYQNAGGKASFSQYYHARYGAAAMDGTLREHVVFSNHNLAADSAFGEMHLILCRNVLIYFNHDLQDRAMALFTESLVHGGFLCLGTKESLCFTTTNSFYQALDGKTKIFRKKSLP